jgi:hypothetical protein
VFQAGVGSSVSVIFWMSTMGPDRDVAGLEWVSVLQLLPALSKTEQLLELCGATFVWFDIIPKIC